MGWQAVTICVLVIISVLLGWRRFAMSLDLRDSRTREQVAIAHADDAISRYADENLRATKFEGLYTALVEQLRERALAPKTVPKDDSTVRARNSSDVRRLTEKEFGGKPDGAREN